MELLINIVNRLKSQKIQLKTKIRMKFIIKGPTVSQIISKIL